MWNVVLAVIALVGGFVLVFQSQWTLPSITARYMAIAVLAVIDSAVGALRALSVGEYDRTLFLSGLLMNAAGAALLVLLGDQLGVDIYLAAVFAFGYRVFQNLGALRRGLIFRWRHPSLRRRLWRGEEGGAPASRGSSEPRDPSLASSSMIEDASSAPR